MRFIKTARHKSFEYQPLYYDKDKLTEEEMDGEFSIREAYAREKRKVSPVSSFYNDTDERREIRKNSRYRKMAFLMAMLAELYVVFGMESNMYVEIGTVFALFVTLVFFIREVNKY